MQPLRELRQYRIGVCISRWTQWVLGDGGRNLGHLTKYSWRLSTVINHVPCFFLCALVITDIANDSRTSHAHSIHSTHGSFSQQQLLMLGMAAATTVCGCRSLPWADCWPPASNAQQAHIGTMPRGHKVIGHSTFRQCSAESRMAMLHAPAAHDAPPTWLCLRLATQAATKRGAGRCSGSGCTSDFSMCWKGAEWCGRNSLPSRRSWNALPPAHSRQACCI
jgi:hypothetical protein